MQAAGEAMRDAMREATARYIGADLRMSGFRGAAVDFDLDVSDTAATLTLSGGTYALADKGRRRASKRLYAQPYRKSGRRAALATPRGYRRSARGSRTAGFNITDRHGQDSLDEGVEAATKVVRTLFDKALR